MHNDCYMCNDKKPFIASWLLTIATGYTIAVKLQQSMDQQLQVQEKKQKFHFTSNESNEAVKISC